MDRRQFLTASAALAGASMAATPMMSLAATHRSPEDEDYWNFIRKQYEVTDKITNMEAGYWGIMSIPVTQAYIRNTHFINSNSTYYVRREYRGDYNKIIARIAKKLGVGEDELVLTRNATEAMSSLINGYNKLNEGDTVIYADQDYGAMQSEMRYLKKYRRVNVVEIAAPEPASKQDMIDAYERALNDHPKCKMILLTHVSNRTGIINPVKEITAMAKGRGVDVLLDAAHSWGQFDFDFQDLGVDFCGFNMHKWIGVPLGVGLLYIRKNRVLDIDPLRGEAGPENDNVRTRIHTGTVNFASVLTIPDALDFREGIGQRNIEGRLRALRNQWVSQVRGNDKVEILTPDDENMYAAITSFRIKGKTSYEDNAELMTMLHEKYGIFTVAIGGLAKGSAIRVSPSLYNSRADCDKLAAAIKDITG
ncbi:aminotransferase class V-fold PLP-dependent enzyme [Pseudemcibacter aquimaris]|uniref:aminotransferase class V-fold PLP-dependent enzyme n=1 Tax=Pseudemcibacter aquimaris TaxID=2857064 RepID=UPI002010D96D|nr:aminotransferase class V-fold PLP-dependent enzyme [Pseudemcibacter aquimaris]MCC3860784.1 aminotransferase class V-fold PLP-dependent enzyme [Pseudemcibacter aquimaris]WDU59604.1 aminotransferase class V-fold PLP-dependent enzyme [Pseudemcibacter aquimaris]